MAVVHHRDYASLVQHLAGGSNRPTLTLDRINGYARANNIDAGTATKRLAAQHGDEGRLHERGDHLPNKRTMRPAAAAATTPTGGDSSLLTAATRRVTASGGRLDLRDAIRAESATNEAAVADYREAFNCGRR